MKNILKLIILSICIPLIGNAQNIRVINMIPNALSNETNQDSEPNLAVNPANPLIIVGTAFTPNPTGSAATAPVFISQDGGNNWVLNNIVPSLNGNTGDITTGISRNNVLYSGILTGGYTGPNDPQMQILRMTNYTLAGTMGNLLTRTNEDQPYVETITPLGGALRNNDLVYVGHNDFNAASGRTASIEQSLNAATAPAPANLTTERLEVRTTFNQDGPPIRTAAHPNGTVYGIFYRRTNSSGSTRTGDVIVVRDNDWGQGATSYNDLTDPGDGLAGRRVAAGINWTWNTGSAMGQERLGDRASIAVDPRDSRTVYIAYIDRPAGAATNSATIHVRRSTDSGNNWSADLLTVNNSIVPQLAVNIRGDVGILYQQLTGAAPTQQWESHFRQSGNGGTTWSDNILSQTPSNTPVRVFGPYLGDYAGLKAVGKDFFGVFSANNTPNNANFPNGVTYQRNANFVTNNLRNLANTANVSISIDPFFFAVQQITDNQDFYVRDWTDNVTTFDNGLEPSTHPVFYTTSDVWNRRSNAPAAFNANDQPQSQDPRIASLGNNFAFARVHRKATGSAQTVTLHFLKSEFGTGSSYVVANTTADPTLSFAAGEQVKTMSTGYEWTLNATTSTHTCLAVEISTPNDPVVTPTLLGRAPGWPDTDLSVLYDNNKAQRNMGVYTTGSGDGGTITYYAVIHNAATFRRDMVLEYVPSLTFTKLFKEPVLTFPMSRETKVSKNQIVIPNMQPGENRWIGITIPVIKDTGKEPASVAFTEIVNNIPVNGFTIAVKSGSPEEAAFENYLLYASNVNRISRLFENPVATEEAKSVLELIEKEAKLPTYVEYMKKHGEVIKKITTEVIEKSRTEDALLLKESMGSLLNSISTPVGNQLITMHSDFNHKLDAYLTMIDKKNGDIADILQNVRWQIDLYRSVKYLREVNGVKELLEKSMKFEEAFYARKVSYKDYPELLNSLMEFFKATAEIVKQQNILLEENIREMVRTMSNPQYLQKAHRDYLLKLELLR